MNDPEPLDPANAEELATLARETGAEVLRGALRYPGESGGWQLGKIDLSEHLDRYRDQELVIIIASIGKAGEVEKPKYICGFVMNELGECPRCKLQIQETAKGLRKRWQREMLFREIDQIVDEEWEDSEPDDEQA